jgi:hypothetical protein
LVARIVKMAAPSGAEALAGRRAVENIKLARLESSTFERFRHAQLGDVAVVKGHVGEIQLEHVGGVPVPFDREPFVVSRNAVPEGAAAAAGERADDGWGIGRARFMMACPCGREAFPIITQGIRDRNADI